MYQIFSLTLLVLAKTVKDTYCFILEFILEKNDFGLRNFETNETLAIKNEQN